MARPSHAARILSVIDVVATTALLLLIFVLPTYTTAGEELSSSGAETQTAGSATMAAVNPQALAELTAISVLAVAALGLALVTAWRGSQHARTALAVLLIPLSVLSILGLFSIGILMAPLVAIGWVVFVLGSDRTRQIASSTHEARIE